VIPKDGIRKRVRFVKAGFDVNALAGKLESVGYDASTSELRIEIGDSSDLVINAELIVRGRQPGMYHDSHGGNKEAVRLTDLLAIKTPFMQLQK
jgi:hypothetical protein